MADDADRIERSIVIAAPRARVWRALTSPQEFGRWFGVRLEGDKVFAPGDRIAGPVTYPGYEHLVCEAWIERVEPERILSWRWHPAAIEPGVDYSQEPMTLVVFELCDVAEGTHLSVVESGLEQIPAARRGTVLRLNTVGWEEQMVNIERYVAA